MDKAAAVKERYTDTKAAVVEQVAEKSEAARDQVTAVAEAAREVAKAKREDLRARWGSRLQAGSKTDGHGHGRGDEVRRSGLWRPLLLRRL